MIAVWKEEFGGKRVFFALFGVLAAAVVVMGVVGRARLGGYTFEGVRLRLVNTYVRWEAPAYYAVEMRDAEGYVLAKSVALPQEPDEGLPRFVTVRYRNREITRAEGLVGQPAVYTFSDGSEAAVPWGSGRRRDGASLVSDLQRAEFGLLQFLDTLLFTEPRPLWRQVFDVVSGVFALALGLSAVVFPEAMARRRRRNRLSKRERAPTDFSVWAHRVGGGFLVIGTIIYMGHQLL